MTPANCCVKGCETIASIKQPLRLGAELVLHVPLCEVHDKVWELFVARLSKARKQSSLERRDADQLLDAALALALFPPSEPL
jgi:hypothetical protein